MEIFSLLLFLQICRIHDSAVNLLEIVFDAQSVYKYVRKKITIISEPFTALYANIVSWVSGSS